MKITIFIATLAVLLFALSSIADQPVLSPVVNHPVMTGNEEINAPVAFPPYPKIHPTDDLDVVGDTVVIGTTWHENQHNGSTGRMLEKDEFGYMHFAWMNGLNSGASQRHIYYNYIDSSGNQGWPGTGYQVDYATRAGYVTLDVAYDGRAFPVFHQYSEPDANFWTAVGTDFYPHSGTFINYYTPDIYDPWYFIYEICWPKMQFDRNGLMHIVAAENPAT
ncbi:hypothetical protein CEE37_02550 [candidate division LCP-89 bacterium B3_LCP]|uniref:Uncharacterized protein n=1 Tax=candidate division LCP-89 bacterium B3_LCP TaxID=2012998 RepID=A0A532V2L1_UNCL8|nr:MAG: hypothetical protein CEE37_02550 [candidate division LCP-89 bacterium B3_LCP]